MTLVFAYDVDHGVPLAELQRRLGGKAANLSTMAVAMGLPVPPAFTVSTAACIAYLADGWPDGLDEELRVHMAALEAKVGRRFGDPVDPLLVSVRSGAARSMPGMMDTILNLGLNGPTVAGLAAASGDPGFAADCHARFEASYRSIVGVADVPADPWQQLRGAIEAVFRSWNSDRAIAYREREGIPHDGGTGVTVQAMVFGNRGEDSGTGVLFTRNPATGEPALYGDVLFNAQGEDVVAGTHATEPVAVLDSRLPAVGAELRAYADRLERHYRDCCDIEFTIERGRLYLLQVRIGKRTPQAAVRMAVEMAEDPSFPLSRAEAVERVRALLADPPRAVVAHGGGGVLLATGLAASPGVACGEIALTPDGAVAAADAGRDVILVRAETSPDDVHGMSRARGILTSTGGFASHAAVVARGWGIPAVVGASAVVIGEGAAVIGGRSLAEGAVITIDGATGEVFEGRAAGVEEVVPEAMVLLGWARELGIAVGEAVPGDAPASAGTGDAGPSAETGLGAARRAPARPATGTTPEVRRGLALRMLRAKGNATPDSLGVAMGMDADAAATELDLLEADGLAEPFSGAFRLTDAGREAAAALVAEDRAAWGPAAADAALDAFVVLDRRMKQVVTDWQTKGPGVFNDHADAAYDAAVLARLGDLHRDVEAWLDAAAAGLPRLALYGARLAAAAAQAAAGNGKYIANPRVDSYHGVWFELHEDLIGLAGRTRAEEAAAGRA